MAKNIKVLVNTGNEETNKSFDVTAGSGKAGKPTTIKAVKGARYHLEDPAAKKVGPENIRSKRVGKNLHVMLDGSSEADLIIEGYYDDAMLTENNRGLYGRAEDGKLYEYIPEDPTPAGLPINLADGGKPVSQVLGGGQIGEEFALSGLVVAAAGFNALTAAAAATGAAALAGGGGGGGGTSGGAVIPTAPAAAPASYADNVGSKQSTTSTDAKTDDTTPGLNIGQVPTGATPKLYVDGVYVPATYDSVTGTLTPNTPLSEGAHSITYTLSNSAGESAKSPAMALTIDTTAPTTTAAVTEITDNVGPTQGPVANGGVTDDTSLTLKGTLSAPLAAGETIRIYDGSTFLGTATVGANNTWSFTDTRTLANGAVVSYTARVADEALNQSAAGTAFTATVDTSVPTISITSVAGDTVTDLVNGTNGTFDATERGANATTVTTKPVISGTSTFAAGLTAKITLNIAGADETLSTTINANGTWSVELTDVQAVKLNHGNTYTIVASVTNSANTTAIDSNNGIVINTAQPDVPTVINNNSGTTTPTLTGLAMKEDPSAPGTFIALQTGDTMSVTVGGATYNVTLGSLPNGFTYDATTHQWSLNTAAATASSGTLALVNGNTYNVGVSVTSGVSTANPSGVTKTDVSTGELVINTIAPTITLDPISDGYINASEKVSDLVISGTTDAQVGSKVTITGLDGTARTATVIAGTNGANTFSLIVTGADVAGFTGSDTTKTVHADVLNAFNVHGITDKDVIIDTAAPTTTVTISSISDDTGVSSTDFITNDSNGLTINATLGTALANGEKLWYSKDNGTTWTDITASVTDTSVSHADNTLTTSNTIQMRVGDAAKNYAAAASKYIVIDASGSTNPDNGASGGTTTDTNISAVVTVDAISTDTGVSGSDFITSDNSLIYSGSVTGFANNGDVVKVQITPASGNASTTVTAYATVTMTSANTGTWSLDKSAINLADGNYTVVATIADKAGNQVGTSQATQIVTIDTSGGTNTDHGNGSGTPATDGNATSATASIDSISTDTGPDATDFVTNDATLLIKGMASISSAGVAAGDQLLVEIKNNAGTVVANQYVKPDVSGNWELNNQANTLADGKYTIAVHVVDLAGNKVKADADTQVLIVDTNKGGTDASSNTNSTTGASEVDPNAASAVIVAITGITDDTGFNTADYITADGSLTISGTTNGFTNAAGDKVRVQIVDALGKVVAQTYVDSNGTWSFNNQANTLSDGNYTLTAAIVDKADNIVKAGANQALVVSSTAALTNATLAISAISDDTGTSTVDFITQDRTLTINGTVNNFDSTAHKLLVQVINSANQVVTSEANVTVSNGTWALNNGALTNGSLADGKYTIRAVLTSLSGAEIASTITTHSLAIDNAGGTNPDNGSNGSNPTDTNTYAELSITTIQDVAHGSVDSGASTSDFITNDPTLLIQGSVTNFSNTGSNTGDKVRVQIVDSTGAVVAQQYVTPDASGVWSLDNTANTLKDGKYTVKAVIVDAPGNTVNTEVTHSLVIDTNQGGTNNGSNPGNTDSNGAAQVDPNAASGVSVAVTGITTDSGYSATDYITADGTLTISGTTTGFTNAAGTGSAGDKVRVQILNAKGDVVAETYTDPVSGAWSFNNQANTLVDGNYTLKAAIVDAAGNVVKAGADQPLVIDSGNTPTNATLAISSITDDTGVSASDFITSDTSLTISGTTSGFNTSGTDKILVQVLNGTTVVTSGYATAGVNTWTYTAATLAAGNYTLRAVYTTATGVEISPPATHSLVVDDSSSTNPANGSSNGSNATDPNNGSNVTVAITGITDDTGVSATDLITTDTNLVISGNTANFTGANGGAGDVVRVQIINTANGSTAGNRIAYATVDANGNWSLDNQANTLTAGTYTLKADIVDVAGNPVKLGTDRTLIVQTAVDPNNNSNSAAAVLVTAITDDTGASSTDFITADNVLSFSGTVTGYTANGANSDKVKVELLAANGTTVIATAYVDVTVSGGNATWAWPYQTLQADGNYTVRATLVNTAGLPVSTTNGTNTHAFTIDSHGGTNVDPNGNGSSTTDANTSATVAITNISDDTGPSANDFVTKDTTLTYSGTVAGFTANGDKVKLELLAADGTTVVATSYVDPTITSGTNGTWTWAYQTAQSTGNYTVRATIVDVPGNRVNAAAGGQATQIIVVDASGGTNPDNGQGSGSGGNNGGGTDTNTSATATITTIHDVANGSVDSGEDSTDFITNDNSLVVKGTVAGFTSTGATKGDQLLVTILSGSTVVATQYVTPDSAGNWVMNNKTNALPDGAYTINVDIVDLAGNPVIAAAATHSLVIDTNQGGNNNGSNPGNGSGANGTDANAGNTVTVGVTSITDDTGFSNTDYITADHSLVISGTTANFSNTAGSMGDKVRVQVLDSTGKVVAEKYVTPDATTGAWTVDATGTNLPDGSYTLRNAIVDKAGNIVKAGTDQPLVISSTAASSSATVSIASISDDTGFDVTDFITKDNTLTINGATQGYNSSTDKVFVQVLNSSTVVASGYATVDGAGKWTFDATAAHTGGSASLADGSYTVRAVLTNTAGAEVTGTAITHALVVDNASGTNYGGSNGTNGSGATDANSGSGVSVTVTTIHDVANGSIDSGSNNADFITNDNTLVIKGATVGFSATGAGALDKVRVQILDSNNVVVAQQYVTPDTAGNWAIDNKATALSDGKYSIHADIVDAADNLVKAGTAQALVIDTNQGGANNGSNPGNNNGTNGSGTDANATAATIAISSITTDTGFSATDFITSDGTLTISGTTTNFVTTGGAAGDKVRVQIVNAKGDVVAETYTDPSNGTWTFNNQSNTLIDGHYTLKAAIVDAAGNPVSAAADQALVINSGNTPTTATLGISSISIDSGTSATDFVTNDNTLTITGTTDGFAVGGTDKILVQVIKVSDGSVAASGYATHSTATSNAGWTFVTDGGVANLVSAATLANGSYTIRAVYTSNTGVEISTPVTHTLVVDNSGSNTYGGNNGNGSVDPNVTVALSIDSITEDTGVSATDWLTADNQLVINGSAPGFTALNGGAGDVVRVQIVNGSTVVRTDYVLVDANGHWALDNTANTLADGTYTVKADILDIAGNPVKSAADKTIVIHTNNSNTTDPNTSASVTINAISDDSGTVGDFNTNDTTLTYSGTVANFTNNGDLVKLVLTNAHGDVVATQYVTPTTSGTGAQSGTWTWAYQTAQSGGNYTLTATVVDTAGSRLNSAAGGQATQLVVIDTTAPTTTAAVTAINDNEGLVTGVVATGGITDDVTPGVSGTLSAALATGETVRVYNGATYVGDAIVSGTTWTFTDNVTNPASGTTVSYTARVADKALNQSAAGTAYTATINTSVPTLTISSIAGDAVVDAGNGTYSALERGNTAGTTIAGTRPVISGTSVNVEQGQTVSVTLNIAGVDKTYTATVDANGAWTTTALSDADAVALNHGNTYAITASVSNTAGKQAIDHNNGMFIDIAAPDIPTVVNTFAGTTTPTLSGAAQKAVPGTPVTYIALATGDTLTVTVGGATYTGIIDTSATNNGLPTGMTYDTATHTWSLNTATATRTSGTLTLASGSTYDVGVTVTAGSVSEHDVSAGELVINTTAPTLALNPISGDGYINAMEKGQALSITGTTTAQVGATVTLTGLDGNTYSGIALAGATGQPNTFVITVPAANVTAFSVDGSTLHVAAHVTNQYNLSANATQDVVIDITGPAFSSATAAAAVFENIDSGADIYTAAATDSHGVSYTLKAGTGDVSKFSINSSTGHVTLNESPNYEAQNSYSFTVVATDAAGNTTEKPVTLAINNLNEAPTGANSTITMLEDGSKTFVASDFGFTDGSDLPANALSAVIITTLPTPGTLKFNGTAVTLNQSIAVADLGGLVFAPAANANGVGYTTIGFKVQDNGGTANGGANTSTSANTLTIDVTAVNDAPVAVADTHIATEASGGANTTAGVDPSGNVLTNDTDVDNATNTLVVKDILKGTTGSATTVAANSTVVVDATTHLPIGGTSIAGLYGTLYMGSDGSYTYVVDQNNTTVQALNVGGSVNDVFTYTAKDPDGLTSATTLTVQVNGANDAPVMTAQVNQTTNEDVTFTGQISSLLTGTVSDFDGTGYAGIAITWDFGNRNTANGTWYWADAQQTTWTEIVKPGYGGSNAIYLNATDYLRFVPFANYNGSSYQGNLVVKVADSALPATASGTVLDLSGATASYWSSVEKSITVTAASVNDAPVVNTSTLITMSAVNEDPGTPTGQVGTLVSTLFSAISDPDTLNGFVAAQGLAITGVNSNGTLYFSTDNGTTWAAATGTLSDSNALLLSGANRVFFQPNANWNGTVADAFTYRAWDQTNATSVIKAGAQVSIAATGGSTAYSTATSTVGITVNAVNDAPVIVTTANSITTLEDNAITFVIGTQLTGKVTDADGTALQGIGILQNTSTSGTWAYSTDGGINWTNFPISLNSASNGTGSMYLSATDSLRYTPSANANGSGLGSLSFRALDASFTPTVSGSIINTNSSGGTSAVSSEIGNFTVNVTSVNDAPVLTNGSTLAYTENNAATAINTAITVADVDNTTLTSATVKISNGYVSGQDVLSFVADSATMGNIAGTVSGDTVTLTSSGSTATQAQWQAALRAVSYSNSSDAPTTAARTVSYVITDGALNSTALTSTINVAAVNDAPVAVADTASIQEAGGRGNNIAGTTLASTTSGSSTLNVLANDTDVDSGDTKSVSAILKGTTGTATAVGTGTSSSTGQSIVGDYGTLVIGADGSYTYAVNQSNASVQALNVGSAALNDVFTYTVKDAAGLTSTATLTVAVSGANDAPVYSGTTRSTTEDVTFQEQISSLLAGRVTDVDSTGVAGIAIIQDFGNRNGSNGTWYWADSTQTTWTAISKPAYNNANAIFLKATDYLRYVPNANADSSAQQGNLVVRVADDSMPVTASGTVLDLNNLNSSSSFNHWTELNPSIAVNLTPVNDAPVINLTTAVTMTATTEDATAPGNGNTTAGMAVSDIFPVISDVDTTPTAVKGIAITSVNGNGTLYYTSDNGVTWQAASGLAINNALHLDTNSRVYFKPNANWNGTIDNAFLYVAWDKTNSATVGSKAAISGTGGSTAYSLEVGKVGISVSAVNDAPANTVPGAQTAAEDTDKVITGLSITDVDAGAATNMSVTLTVTNGTITMLPGAGTVTLTNNSTSSVTLTGTLANINTLLGLANAVSYKGNLNYNGSDTLTMLTSDNGNTGTGGTLTDSDNVAITITAVNDAPVLDNTVVLSLPAAQQSVAPVGAVGMLVSALVSGSTDVDAGALQGIAITGINTAGSLWISTDGGATWTQQTIAISDSNAVGLYADADNRVYYQPGVTQTGTIADAITIRAWDHSGSAGDGTRVNATTTGGTTSFSTATDTVAATVAGVTPGQSVVDLGTSGKLIAPIQVGGDWFYYWDRSGDGTSADTGTANGGLDYTTHNVLDLIFNKDINGVTNTTVLNADGLYGTTDVYRYGTINGVLLALPMAGTTALSVTMAGTSVSNNTTTVNPTYGNTILGIWDATNGTSTGTNISGVPTGWSQAGYWAAASATSGHFNVGIGTGSVYDRSDTSNSYVALQMVKANTAPVLDAAQSPTLTSVSASAAVPTGVTGDLVSTLVTGISDADSGAAKGIAITGVHSGGTLYYSLNGGTTWTAASGLSSTNALLLAADSDTRVFYQANGTSGTITDAITFRAWDETQHAAEGVYADTSSNGGKAEFSTATDTVSVFASLPLSTTLDLGTVSGVRLNLIAKVTTSNGKVLYHVDGNGNNSVDGSDGFTHDQLDTLFNGGADTTGLSSAIAGQDTERTVIVNGYTLVLPTRAEFNAWLSNSTTTSWATSYGWAGTLTYYTADLNGAGNHWDVNNSGSGILSQSRADSWITGFAVQVLVPVAPVVLDLNRDGTFSYTQVAMDVNGSNHLSLTQWAGAQDGVLVWDKLGDGVVHDNSQYAFGQYATSTRVDAAGHNRVASDLEGLSDAFDTNHDGVFNAADAQFAEFKVWQDTNQNGVSDAGEVRSLADWGITGINLISDGVQRTPVEGVTEVGHSTAALADGSSMQVADALFAYNALDYNMTGNAMNLLGADMHLDLSSVVAVHSNLTAMDLTGTGANTVKLNLADVLSLATDASIANGVHKLTLTGDANDTVELDLSQWANTGNTVTEGDHTYAVYNASSAAAAQLLIDQHMVLASHG
jgi:VCBS repeat-containing protein